jgi:hypothetical protein
MPLGSSSEAAVIMPGPEKRKPAALLRPKWRAI